ncbi:hypothetical protein BH20BAC1_BH20BAC1_25860 [soil metagenome]
MVDTLALRESLHFLFLLTISPRVKSSTSHSDLLLIKPKCKGQQLYNDFLYLQDRSREGCLMCLLL